jgi:hypothetical protein
MSLVVVVGQVLLPLLLYVLALALVACRERAGLLSSSGVKGQLDFPLDGQLISLLADRLFPCRRSADSC